LITNIAPDIYPSAATFEKERAGSSYNRN